MKLSFIYGNYYLLFRREINIYILKLDLLNLKFKDSINLIVGGSFFIYKRRKVVLLIGEEEKDFQIAWRRSPTSSSSSSGSSGLLRCHGCWIRIIALTSPGGSSQL